MKKVITCVLKHVFLGIMLAVLLVNIDLAFGITAPHYEVFDGISVTSAGVEKQYRVVCDRRETIGYRACRNWYGFLDEKLGTSCVAVLEEVIGY